MRRSRRRIYRLSQKAGRPCQGLRNSELAAGGGRRLRAFLLAVGLDDDRVLFTCADTGRTIVVFFGHPRVAMIEKRAGEMRMAASIDGGRRRAGGPEQMGRDDPNRFTREL